MNSQRDGKLHIDLEEQIEDYLDHLCAPLVGIMPYKQRQSLRREAHTHLECLAAEYQEQSDTGEKALFAAMREFGEPGAIGHELLYEWLEGNSNTSSSRLVKSSAARAFAWFGTFTALNLFIIEGCWQSGDQNCLWLFPTVLFGALSPMIAGCLTGIAMPGRAKQGVYIAIGISILVSAAAGLLLLPDTTGLLFALFQLCFWMPVGSLCTIGMAYLVRQHRCQRYWRLVHKAHS